MLQKIGSFDKKISRPLIQADNIVISIILYPFAAFFHPKLILFAYFAVYYFSGMDAHATLIYLIGTGLCLLTTFILKKLTKRYSNEYDRPRPQLIPSVKKPHHFRKKEKNNSFPSGDCIQSALFTAYLSYFGVPVSYLIAFHVGVCLGRVYYMCHWFFDTFASTILGCLIALFLTHLRYSRKVLSALDLDYGL